MKTLLERSIVAVYKTLSRKNSEERVIFVPGVRGVEGSTFLLIDAKSFFIWGMGSIA